MLGKDSKKIIEMASEAAEKERACKERYLFACLGAVLASGPNSASELSIHALRRSFADLDNGNALDSESVAISIKKVIDLVTDSKMLDIETVKAFFLAAGLGTAEAQRCAKLAVVNNIPSPRKLSLLLFRDGPQALSIFGLSEEEELLVRHSLEQIYPMLVPPSVSMHRRLSIGAASMRRASAAAAEEHDDEPDALPMHAEEILARLREVADSMTLTQLCSTLRQLLTLPDSSLSDIVKAACKALGVRATGTLKEDAALCFFAAMEPAGGWKLAYAASHSQARPPPVMLSSSPTHTNHHLSGAAVTAAVLTAPLAQEKAVPSAAAPLSLQSAFSPQRERRNTPVPLSSSRSSVSASPNPNPSRPSVSASQTALAADGEAGTPVTPIFAPSLGESAGSGKIAPHHSGTPPVLPTTVLPTLGADVRERSSSCRMKSFTAPGGSPAVAPAEAVASAKSLPISSMQQEREPPSVAGAAATPASVDNVQASSPSAAPVAAAPKEEKAKEGQSSVRAALAVEAMAHDAAGARRGSVDASLVKSLEKQLTNASLARAMRKLRQGAEGKAGTDAPSAPPAAAEAATAPSLGPPLLPHLPPPSPSSPISRQLTKPADTGAETPLAAPLSPIVSPESAPSTPVTMLSCLMEDARLTPDGRDWPAASSSMHPVPAPAAAATTATSPLKAAAPVAVVSIASAVSTPTSNATPSNAPASPSAASLSTPTNAGTTAATPSSSITKTPAARPDMRPATRARSPGVQQASPTAVTSINLELMPGLLTLFYRRTNPSREKDVPSILQAYKGRELELVRKLEKQYSCSFIVAPSL